MSTFSTSSVMEATRESVRAHWESLLPILLLLGAPNLLYSVLQPMFPTNIAISYGLYVLALAPAMLGCLITMNRMRASNQGLEQAEVYRRSMAFWGHALALFVVTVLCMIPALLAFIVPAFILAMSWFVVTPVLLFEGRDIKSTLRRSSQLTQGHRWTLFTMYLGLCFQWFAILFAPMFLVAMGWQLLGSGDFQSHAWNVLSQFILFPVTTVFAMYINAMTVHSYDELVRVERDTMM